MERKKENAAGVVVQGSILAIASIVARIIGMLYRVPVTRIIGDYGNGVYAFAYEVYNMMLLISCYSLPTAISKLVAARTHNGEHKNAYKIYKAGLIFVVIVGSLAAVFTFVMADFISTNLIKDSMVSLSLRVLAPTILVVAVMGVMRGYFQGLGTMLPTAVSQIIEQIINAIVSVLGAYYLFSYGSKIALILQNEKYAPACGAAGSALGTFLGAIVGFLLLLFMLTIYKPVLKRRMKKDKTFHTDSYREIYAMLFSTVVPIILSTAVYNSTVFIDQTIFNNVMNSKGVTNYTELFGVFNGKYRLLVNVPVAFASAMASSTIPSLTAAVASKDRKLINRKINISIRFIMMIAFPSSVGLAVLGSPILQLLLDDTSILPVNLLRMGSIAVVLYSLSTLSNGILQGLNRMRVPVRNAVVSLVIHVILIYLMLKFTNLNIYAVVLGNILFAFIICVLNAWEIKKATRYRQEIYKSFLVPIISSAIMGIAAYLIYYVMCKLTQNITISFVFAFIVAVVVYAVVFLCMKGFTEDELLSLPKGTLLVKVARKFHLL